MSQMPLGVVLAVGGDFADRLHRLQQAGFATMQLYYPPREYLAEPGRSELKRLIADSGFTVTSVVSHHSGESYADVAAVRRTVGLLPRETRAARVEATKRAADYAREIGCKFVFAHIGYVPEDRGDPDYQGLVDVTREICDYFQSQQVGFNLETGQEPAAFLAEFIREVGRDNLGINFDPANIILYGMGDPIAALDVVGKWVRGVHCKDGAPPTAGGQLGTEQPLGQGQVGIERFVAKLKQIGYSGPLTIEREIPGEQQMQDFFAAKKLLEGIKAKLGIG